MFMQQTFHLFNEFRNLNIWAININQLFMRISRNHHQLARSEFDETAFSKNLKAMLPGSLDNQYNLSWSVFAFK